MEPKKYVDINREAVDIITQHTKDFMSGASFVPTSAKDLYDKMVEECSHILTTAFLNYRYSPMEYNAIRNEIGKLLWNLFQASLDENPNVCNEY